MPVPDILVKLIGWTPHNLLVYLDIEILVTGHELEIAVETHNLEASGGVIVSEEAYDAIICPVGNLSVSCAPQNNTWCCTVMPYWRTYTGYTYPFDNEFLESLHRDRDRLLSL